MIQQQTVHKSPRIPNPKSQIPTVTLLYVLLTLILTWPLAARMTRDVAADFGDPLLNSWILAWDVTHLGRGLWHANIFHPHPLALAYSEHLLPQAIQILPIYAATKNPILCYNLLFLSTFVLSGLGMFLLARELTGSRAAGFVAGLAYAFAPYRFSTLSHLQVLSSAWMPFALYGLRRYFETGRTRPLIGGAAAWLLQNLSCGYYLFFFSPLLLLYIVWEMTTRRRWADARTIVKVVAACAAVGLATLPFLLAYLELRRLGFGPRPLLEIDKFCADVHAYLTADLRLHILGRVMRAWPKPEGALFPGFTITALAIAAAVATWRTIRRHSAETSRSTKGLAWLLAGSCVVLVALMFGWTLRLPLLKITSFTRVLWIVVTLAAVLFVTSAPARSAARRWWSHPVGFFCGLTALAALLSLGPHIHAKGRIVADPNLYTLFYTMVPGFDGLRVPARFAMIVALGLAVLAGFGARLLETSRLRPLVTLAAVLMLVESFAAPIGINENSTDYRQTGLAPLPATLTLEPAADNLYRFVGDLPANSAIVELPFGEPAFETRYMFYSTRHWKPLVNGYSGGEPAAYSDLNRDLQDVFTRPERAWRTLIASQATHAIVHEAFYATDRGPKISAWLRSNGASEIGTFGTHRVFALPARHSF